MSTSRHYFLGIAAYALFLAPSGAAPAKWQTLDAFAVWRSEAQIVQTAPKRAVLMGTLGGDVFVETDTGPDQSGAVACPATIEVDGDTHIETGHGYCTFTAYDGAKAFGQWTCKGPIAEGCRGDFHFTGGTDRFATIKGSSDIIFLANEHDLDEEHNGAVSDDVRGITLWPDLQLSVRQAFTQK